MSKRNRKKLKKVLRSQAEQGSPEDAQVSETVGNDTVEVKEKPVVQSDPEIEEPEVIKKEITKILITVVILVLIVVAIYFINTKTNLVLNMGEFIAKKLNLSI
jgi:hypothetical protein